MSVFEAEYRVEYPLVMQEIRLLVKGLFRLGAKRDRERRGEYMGEEDRAIMLLPKVGLLAETLSWSSAKRQTGAAALSVIVMTFAPLR